MADATNPMDPNDDHLLQRQFTTVFEYLINVSGFELPFTLVLLDADDSVIGSKIIGSAEHEEVLSSTDFIRSEAAEEGLRYPMHILVRDGNENVAYGYLGDIDAEPEIQMVHVAEDEST